MNTGILVLKDCHRLRHQERSRRISRSRRHTFIEQKAIHKEALHNIENYNNYLPHARQPATHPRSPPTCTLRNFHKSDIYKVNMPINPDIVLYIRSKTASNAPTSFFVDLLRQLPRRRKHQGRRTLPRQNSSLCTNMHH
jgi:hypothetical protein